MKFLKSQNYWSSLNQVLINKGKFIFQYIKQLQNKKYQIPLQIISIIKAMCFNSSFYILEFSLSDLLNYKSNQQFYFLCYWIKRYYPNFTLRLGIKYKIDYQKYNPWNQKEITNNYILQIRYSRILIYRI